jgi:hypothetical protein
LKTWRRNREARFRRKIGSPEKLVRRKNWFAGKIGRKAEDAAGTR